MPAPGSEAGPAGTAGVAVDVVVLTLPEPSPGSEAPGGPLVLAARRGPEPFAGSWALPGARVGADEDLEQAVGRVLTATAGPEPDAARRLATPRHLEQLATFGAPGRDPRGRVVSVSYLALLPRPVGVRSGAAWFPATDAPPLGFDHAAILAAGLSRLRSKLGYSTVAYGLLPDAFTLSELQAVYEAALGRPLDKRNFRRKVSALAFVEETGVQRRGPHRPAQLHRFRSRDLVLFDDAVLM